MYNVLLHTHSYLRYLVLLLLVIVTIKSLLGWLHRQAFSKMDDRLSLWLLIVTHLQFLAGLFLYFISPFVQFSGTTMKDHTTRYWTVEHGFMMLIAIALITIARVTHKKLAADEAKHRRLFILNVIALMIIVITILYSGRGLISSIGGS